MASSEILRTIFTSGKSLRYKKGEIIFRNESKPDRVFFMSDGYVKMSFASSLGEEVIVAILRVGDIFPIPNASFEEEEVIFTALTEAHLLSMPLLSFQKAIYARHEYILFFLDYITQAYNATCRQIEFLAFGNASRKISAILRFLLDNFGVEEGEKIIIPIPLTHRDIASFVGVTRETASIELERLEAKRIISFSHHVIRIHTKEKLYSE